MPLGGQSAIEFLSTYSFVILIVAIALSVLVLYFSLPKTIIPFQCNFYSEFYCTDAAFGGYNSVSGQSTLVILASDSVPGVVNVLSFNAVLNLQQSVSGYCTPNTITDGQYTLCYANFNINPIQTTIYSGSFSIFANYCYGPAYNVSNVACPASSNYVYSGSIRLQPGPISGISLPGQSPTPQPLGIWISNYNGNQVTELNPTTGNTITSFPTPGGGPSYGIAVAPGGNIWVTSYNNANVIEFTTTGNIIGTFPAGTDPGGIAIESDGNVWINNVNQGTATVLSSTGNVIGTYSTGGCCPTAPSIDHNGNVWFGDAGANPSLVSELSPSGNIINEYTTYGIYGTSGFPSMTAIAVAPNGNIWETDRFSNHTYGLFISGGVGNFGLFTAVSSAQSTGSYGVAVAPDGNVWFTEAGADQVTVFSPVGNTVGAYGVGTYPYGVAIDSNGNVWVADKGSDQITELSSSGSLLGTFADGSEPLAIAIAPYSAPKSASPQQPTVPVILASGQDMPAGIASSGGSVYWADSGSGNVMGCTAASCHSSITELASEGPSNGVFSIAAGDGYVYWGVSYTTPGSIMGCQASNCGGTVGTVATFDNLNPSSIAVYGGNVIWVAQTGGCGSGLLNYGNIEECPVGSGCGVGPTQLFSVPSDCLYMPDNLAIANDVIYYTVGGSLYECSITNCFSSTYDAANSNFHGVAVDSGNVFISDPPSFNPAAAYQCSASSPSACAPSLAELPSYPPPSTNTYGIASGGGTVAWAQTGTSAYPDGLVLMCSAADCASTTQVIAMGQYYPEFVNVSSNGQDIYWTDYYSGNVMMYQT